MLEGTIYFGKFLFILSSLYLKVTEINFPYVIYEGGWEEENRLFPNCCYTFPHYVTNPFSRMTKRPYIQGRPYRKLVPSNQGAVSERHATEEGQFAQIGWHCGNELLPFKKPNSF